MTRVSAKPPQRLRQAAWKEQGRQEDLLLSPGFQLERARTLIADGGDIPIEHVRDFVDRLRTRVGRSRQANAVSDGEASRSVPLIWWRPGGDFRSSKPAPTMRLDKKTNIHQLFIWRARIAVETLITERPPHRTCLLYTSDAADE